MINCPICESTLRAKMKIRLYKYGCVDVQVDHYKSRQNKLIFISTCNLNRKDFPQIYADALSLLISRGFVTRKNTQGNLSILMVRE